MINFEVLAEPLRRIRDDAIRWTVQWFDTYLKGKK